MRLFPGLLTLIHQLGIIRTCQVPWGQVGPLAGLGSGDAAAGCRLENGGDGDQNLGLGLVGQSYQYLMIP